MHSAYSISSFQPHVTTTQNTPHMCERKLTQLYVCVRAGSCVCRSYDVQFAISIEIELALARIVYIYRKVILSPEASTVGKTLR